MQNKEIEKVIQERNDLHGVVHAFVAEFRKLKAHIEMLERELREIHDNVGDPQLDLEFPQKED